MKRLLAVIAAAGLLAWTAGLPGGAADDKKADKSDQDKFQGDWVLTKAEQAGQEIGEEALKTAKWSVKGTKYTFEIGGMEEEGNFKLEPDKKPAGIELDIKSGNDAGKKQGGIYKFQGDTMVICFNRPGETEKPTKFSTEEGGGFFMITLKKKAKDDKDKDK
jgi:uncharacterized protein (TIGR03067 family)